MTAAPAPSPAEQAVIDRFGIFEPTRRLRSCAEAWPDAETGACDPRCCRFPKSCSATVYEAAYVDDSDLEPPR